MDEINIDEYTRSGVTKYITEPDEQGYIFKYFKNDGIHIPYSFEQQNNIIEKKKQYFGKFIPETELIKNDDGSYCIRQKFIEGKLLKFIDIYKLDKKVLSDLLELIKSYIAYGKDEGIEIDVMGCQHDINPSMNIRDRRRIHYSRLFSGFLSSTNIMISNDGRVYMVDVCDTIPVKPNRKVDKIKNSVRLAIMELGIKKSILKLNLLINAKRGELFSVLSW